MRDETRLWLIRHAPVAGPRGVIHDSDAPADISDVATIAALRAKLPMTATIVASPSRRTLETAFALGLRPIEDASFREQSFGSWTGRRHDEIAKELGAKYQEFWRAPATSAPPGGESFVEQIARVRDGIARLPPGDVLLIAHSGTVRAAIAIALDVAPETALRFVIDPLSLTRIDRLENGWRVGCVNR